MYTVSCKASYNVKPGVGNRVDFAKGGRVRYNRATPAVLQTPLSFIH